MSTLPKNSIQSVSHELKLLEGLITEWSWIDFIAIASLVGTIISIGVTIRLYKINKKQTDSVEMAVKTLEDINRPFKNTFPGIVHEIREMCLEALDSNSESELFIMNRTSSFGRIHMYNPKIISDYNLEKENIDSKTRDILKDLYDEIEHNKLQYISDPLEKARVVFDKNITTLSNDIKNCGEQLKPGNFKLIVLNGKHEDKGENDLYINFFQNYLKKVKRNSDDGKNAMVYYEHNEKVNKRKGGMPLKKFKKNELLEEKIFDSVKEHHNSLIEEIIEDRGLRQNEKECEWLKYQTNIPMQIYLLKTKENGKPKYKTFIINTINANVKSSKKPIIDGLLSHEESLYNVFVKLFNRNFAPEKENLSNQEK